VTVASQIVEAESNRGVSYVPVGSAGSQQAAVAVLIKRWSDAAEAVGPTRVFLATDVHVPDPAALSRCIRWATVTAALSPFMRDRVTAAVPAPGMQVLPPPLAREDYADSSQQRERTLLYCSMPDRGLYYLKDVFPAIRRQVADATLVITSDFTLWGRAGARAAFLRFFDAQPGIRYLGHVDRATLLAEQQRARVMAYPCTFEEGFCIAAAECMAAGAVPVTTNNYALRTTVGDAGVLVNGRPRSWFYRRAFVKAAVRLLSDDEHWHARSTACRDRARRWDSQAIAEQFLTLVTAPTGIA
jgi:glycosyltransferase involved in cell wall biosynthesis